MKGYSQKPCPVCKEKEGYKVEAGACRDCLSLIEDGKKHRAQTEALDAPKRKYLVCKYGDSYGYFQNARDADSKVKEVSECVSALVTALHGAKLEHASFNEEPDTEPISPKLAEKGGWGSDSKSVVVLSPPVADAIRNLNKLLKEAFLLVYEGGKKNGENLLFNLASGKLTVSQFNEATIKEKS